MNQPETGRLTRRSTYSLASLLTLMSFCAVLLAGLQAMSRGLSFSQAMVIGGIGGLVCGVLGMMLGLYHYQRLRGAFLGFIAGAIVGLTCTPLVQLEGKWFLQIMLAYLLGSCLLVGFCWFLSRGQQTNE